MNNMPFAEHIEFCNNVLSDPFWSKHFNFAHMVHYHFINDVPIDAKDAAYACGYMHALKYHGFITGDEYNDFCIVYSELLEGGDKNEAISYMVDCINNS